MRIGIVCYPTYGGSGVVATELGRMLARRGHQIHIIAASRPFRLLDEFSENIYCHEVSSMDYPVLGDNLYTLSLATKIAQVALDERLDIIHVHYAVPHAICAMLAMEMLSAVGRQIPVVTTLHGTDITLVGRAPSFAPAVRLGITRSDAVVAVSNWLREETLATLRLPNNIKVIHNFVDANVFRPGTTSVPRRRFAADDEKIVMHVSNFRPVKRVRDVVLTFAQIASDMPSKLLMIGDGPDREQAISLAREMGIMNRVWFLGRQDFVQEFLPMADVLLFPSDGESFGLAAAEAMACGVPVIAARRGGIPEVIDDGLTGYLCPVGDTVAMADAAVKLLKDDDLRLKMGDAARQAMLKRFPPSRIVPQYEALYTALMAGNAPFEHSGAEPEDQDALAADWGLR